MPVARRRNAEKERRGERGGRAPGAADRHVDGSGHAQAAAVRSRLTKKCVQLVCMRDHYFGYIIMDNIAATKVPGGAFAVSAARRRARPPRHDCHASKEAIFTVEFARAAPCPCGYMRRKYRDHHSS